MKLFLVHCGYYDPQVCDGVYEAHINFFVVAEDFQEARAKAKKNSMFVKKRMHVDGLQQIEAVDGHRLNLEHDSKLEGKSHTVSYRYQDLANKTPVKEVSIH